MKKISSIIICICLSVHVIKAQGNYISFELENLTKPESLLKTVPFNDLYYNLVRIDYTDRYETITTLNNNSRLLAQSVGNEELVADFGYNPFFFGLCEAYCHHRPVVFSPDVVWILICQGFANHINNNSDIFRNQIVDFEGKRELDIMLDTSPEMTDWYDVIESFYVRLSAGTKNNLSDIMLCDFSTSNKVDRLVSEVTLMETVKSYYDFIVLYSVCGIPSITLTGAAEDWMRLKEKIIELEKYDLKWWTKRIISIIDQFISASNGHADIDFWKKMIHVTEPEQCGDSRRIDGWITDFYPYDKYGKRLEGGAITDTDKLPSEIVKVKINSNIVGDTIYKNGAIEIWAGLLGLQQDDETYAITPKSGWLVRYLDQQSFDKDLFINANSPDNFYGIKIMVDSVPTVLKELGHIYRLDITFNKKAFLPEWMKYSEIEYLTLRGKIPLKERRKSKRWFNNVYINPSSGPSSWFIRNLLMGHE